MSNKPSFGNIIKKTLFSNFGIKVLALVVAVFVFVVVKLVA